ncbi:MAG: PQQ-binding-like beta-propeller repeat protein [Anaerolineales bacterium]|jgi:WD40 repeat protein
MDGLRRLAVWGKGPATQVLYAPDGSQLAVISPMGLYLYDPETLALNSFHASSIQVRCAAYASDGSSLVLGMENGTVQLRPVPDGEPSRVFEPAWDDFAYAAQSVAISNDGSLLAAGFRNGGVFVWQADSGELHWSSQNGHDGVLSMAFSPDDETLVTGAENGMVTLYMASDGAILWSMEHEVEVSRVAFSTDGETIASCGGDARAWDSETGELRYTLEDCHDDLAFSPDGLLLLVGSPEWPAKVDLVFANPATGGVSREIENLGGELISAAFSPDGASLATAISSADSRHETTIAIWDVASTRQRSWTSHGTSAQNLSFSPDGDLMAVGFAEGSVWVWGLQDGAIVHAFPPPTAEDDCGTWGAPGEHLVSVTFAPEGSTVNSLHANGCVRSWSVLDGSLLHTMRGNPQVIAAALSPSIEYMAAGAIVLEPARPFITALWRVETGGTPIRTFNSQESSPLVAFSSDGGRLAAFFTDGLDTNSIQIYDVNTGSRLLEIDALAWAMGMQFLPGDSMLAALGLDGTVRLWQTTDGALIATLENAQGGVEPVATPAYPSPPGQGQEPLPPGVEQQISLEFAAALAFSPGGEILASSEVPFGMSLWSIPDGYYLMRLEPLTVEFPLHDLWVGGNKSSIYSAAFSPDGQLLALGGENGEVWLWGIP